ncbi:MAG: ribulose-phosphate 3-epimerase [Clostridia bacterium]|nr:ribulose-phosphate 3-epimerase [Clostridia bacterium]
MAKLAPSLLSSDFSKLGEQLLAIQRGGAHYVHMDIMDGSFVPNITFGQPVVNSLVGKVSLPFDIHLMIQRPELLLSEFVTPQTEFIVVHQEACLHLHRTLQLIKSLGVKAGVALNPATSLSTLDYVWGDIDLLLIMSVNPGFGGQKFIPSSMEKIRAADKIRKEKKLGFVIQLDGGVNLENAAELKEAGVDILVAGAAVFGADDIEQRVKDFVKILED